MPESRFKFSDLRQLLSELGFKEVTVTKPFLGFRHDGSDTLLVLPAYRNNSAIAPHHLAQVGVTLDAKGLMEREAFDRRAGIAPAPRSASS